MYAAGGRFRGPRQQLRPDFDVVGTRAQGMGGAFVAVADDASAAWWNPAGLSSIPVADASVSGGDFSTAGDTDACGVGTDARLACVSHIGLLRAPGCGRQLQPSHRVIDIRPAATATAEPGRQEDTGTAAGRVVRTQYLDATLAQSIGDVLVVGTTLGVVSGETASVRLPAGGSIDDGFEHDSRSCRRMDTRASTHMSARWRTSALCVSVSSCAILRRRVSTTPRVDRSRCRVRYGWARRSVAARRRISGASGRSRSTPTSRRVDAADGRRRAVSVGVERWLASRRVGVRGGARVQTIDSSRAP